MPLAQGDKLGPYTILAPIGAGGMGEVYKARDTRLDRTVAIKVLPEHIARREDLRARFEREARAVASLKHAHICTLYDIGSQNGAGYMVMEFMEGETLADRIAKGPLPLEQALKFATQIADALDRAHRAGVTHRDVKPQNIMLTRDGAKVLDFGLAKSIAKPGPSEETVTVLTTEGTVMGTPQYMAPEQFEGKEADARSDIWAFGAVLYEMVTGQKAFQGKSYSSLLGAILSAEPAPMSVKPFTPTWLERLVRRCLAKDPEDRWQTMRDVVIELQTPPQESVATAAPPKSSRAPWVLAALASVFALTLAAVSFVHFRENPPSEQALIRLDVDLGPDAVSADYNTFAISPKGDRLVYTVRGADGKMRLATRLLGETEPTILEGTENPGNPFFSPDGAWIAYAADGKLRKVFTRGGEPVVICDAGEFFGGTWTDDGTLVVSLAQNAAVAQVPATGGTPAPLGKLSGSDFTQRWPQALPGGNYVLATSSTSMANFSAATILAVSTKTGESKRLVQGSSARYVANPSGTAKSGYLIYQRGDSLFAVGFDPVKLELQGDSVPVADEVSSNAPTGAGHWDVSTSGVLLHRRGRQTNQTWPVVWMDQSGKTLPLVTERKSYRNMRFSPDGNLLALPVTEGGGSDMFVYDIRRDTSTRLTSAGKGKYIVSYPVWTADSKHIFSMYPGPSGFGLAQYRADGASEPQILLDSNVQTTATSLTPDGKILLYQRNDPVSRQDFWGLPLDTLDKDKLKPGKPEVVLQTPFQEALAQFSPDGRWFAYHSDESGRREVYVRPYRRSNSTGNQTSSQGSGGKWQVSKDGGSFPLWAADGKSIYFYSEDGHIMVADCESKDDVFFSGKPRQWSPVPIWNPLNNLPYSLHPDGKRFAVFPVPEPSPEEKGNAHVTMLLNFGDELRRVTAAK